MARCDKLCVLVLFSILFAVTSAFAFDVKSSRTVKKICDAPPASTNTVVIPQKSVANTNELMGEVVVVGTTAYDYQHNATVGKMVAFDPAANMVHVVFTDLPMPEPGRVRRVKYNKVDYASGTPTVVNTEGGWEVNALFDWGGFATLGANPDDETFFPVPAFHTRPVGGEYASSLGIEAEFVPGFFTVTQLEFDSDLGYGVWPKIMMGPNKIAHVVSKDGDNENLYYHRMQYDGSSWNALNNEGFGELIFGQADFISADLAVSPDGQRVVIAQPVNRYAIGVVETEVTNDKELVYWESTDGGETFDFTTEVNVTNFQGPDMDLLPDTSAADVDTLRLWLDCAAHIDHDNLLHMAWSASPFSYIRGDGTVLSRIFYWNEDHNYIVQIADGGWWNGRNPGTNNMILDRPNLFKDPDDGWTWCVYRQFGDQSITNDEDYQDYSEADVPGSDIFITGSPPGEFSGLLWYKGINITNTQVEVGPGAPGEMACERDPAISVDNTGDYLYISYLQDTDAGAYVSDQGVETDSPMMVARIMKQDIKDLMEALPEDSRWVPPYMIHRDGTQYWDPSDAVGESSTLQPTQFELEPVYPNPFNATARIAYSLSQRGQIVVKVYDLLGREVGVLVDRSMQAGRHEVVFNANHLASGVYFIALESGANRQVQKVALIR